MPNILIPAIVKPAEQPTAVAAVDEEAHAIRAPAQTINFTAETALDESEEDDADGSAELQESEND